MAEVAALPDKVSSDQIQSKPTASESLQTFIEGLRDKGIPIDADLVHELQRNVKSWTGVLRKQRGLGSSIYSVPQARHHWGEIQGAHRVNWADLFFDLTFVATSFRLGQLLENVITTTLTSGVMQIGEFFSGGLLFVAIFAVVRSVWESKLQYTSRFGSEDLAHKLLDLAEATLTAVLAVNIPITLAEAHNYNRFLLIFAIIRLCLFGLNALRWAEIRLLSSKRSSKMTGSYFLTEAMTSAIMISISIALIAISQELWTIALMWLISDSFFIVDVIRAFANRWNTKDNTTPLHVEEVVIREGEFVMLMIGEGVLSIILLPFGPDLTLHYQMFVTAFLILSTLQVQHYSSQPAFAEGHALFRSRFRGVLWIKLQTIESGLIVVVGVALKMMIKIGINAYKPNYWPVQWILCIALALTYFLLQVFQVMHAGIVEELDVPWCARWFKLGLYALKAFLALCVVFIPLARAEAFPVLLGVLLLGIATTTLQRVWDGMDRFITQASALAEEDGMTFGGDRVVEIIHKEGDENDEDSAENAGDDGNGQPVHPHNKSILYRMLPKRLKTKRIEAELTRLHAMYGSSRLQTELTHIAENLSKRGIKTAKDV